MNWIAQATEDNRRPSPMEVRINDAKEYDHLTDLPNREGFDKELARRWAGFSRNREAGHFGLLLLDINDFKFINDSLGHPMGDTVLRLMGHAMRTISRKDEYKARYGGDEFAVIVSSADPEMIAGDLKNGEGGRGSLLYRLNWELNRLLSESSNPEWVELSHNWDVHDVKIGEALL